MSNSDQLSFTNLETNCYCAICGIAAFNKCAACSLVTYCSKEHQKIHWKKHKNDCVSYEVI